VLGKKVKLAGVSRHGKNRVREQGEDWQVVGESPVVHFKSAAPGPFLLLESKIQGHPHGPWARWVRLQRDTDFMIEVINE